MTSAGGADASGYYSSRQSNWGTRIFGSYNQNSAYDRAENEFSAILEFERFSFSRFFLKALRGNLALDLMRLRKTELVGTWTLLVVTDAIPHTLNKLRQKDCQPRPSASLS